MKYPYKEFFRGVYENMNNLITKDDVVVEVGCRDDRCVISNRMFNCKKFIGIDKDDKRVLSGMEFIIMDAVTEELPKCDIMITTALIQHYPKEDLHKIMKNLSINTRKYLMLTCPNREVQPKVYGDHKYHPTIGEIVGELSKIGFKREVVYYHRDYINKEFKPTGEFIMVEKGAFTIVARRRV